MIETWAYKKIKKYSTSKNIKISKTQAYIYAFLLGLFAIPAVYLDHYLYENYQDLNFIYRLSIVGLVSIILSIIEIYLLYTVAFKLFVSHYKKYNIDDDEFEMI